MLAFQLIGLALVALFFGALVTGSQTSPAAECGHCISLEDRLRAIFAGRRIAPQGRAIFRDR